MTIQLPPHASADAYADTTFADAYFGSRLNADAFTGATVANKEAALKAATRRLDGELWKGRKSDTLADNSLRFPRSWLYNADGQLEDSTTVPLAIQQACCELALDLLKAAADETAGTAESVLEKIEVGPIKLGYDTDKVVAGSTLESLSGDADRLIAPYRSSSRNVAMVRA